MIKQKKTKINTRNKFINNLIVNGKKNKSEKILLKSFKALQITSKKSLKKLLQLALVSAIPIFKVNIITQKKNKKQKFKILPTFVATRTSRLSHAIKFIVTTARKKKNEAFLQKLLKEILLTVNTKSSTVEIKEETQKQVSLNRNLFTRYKWGKA